MKAIISTSIIIFFISPLYCQLWKQYEDSAKNYSIQKNADKAIEFYNKAKEELQNDSSGTKSYAQICDSLGVSFYRKKQYKEAEEFYQKAIEIQGKVLGKENPDYARSCNNLGLLYLYTRQYEKAEPLLLEAKQIEEKVEGKENPDYLNSCNNLAFLYRGMGKYEKAEAQYLEAKQIEEKSVGKEHPDYASSCENLGLFYLDIGQYEKAEPLMLETKQIEEKTVGKEHLDYAMSCNNLAVLYRAMGKYEKAEVLYVESKQIREEVLGKEHPDYATSCNNLANLYKDMGKYEKAEVLYLESKQIREKVLGRENPDYASSCNNLALLYDAMGKYEKAEALFLESKQIREGLLGKENRNYAASCDNLANLYTHMGQYEKAEALYLEAKQIKGKVLGREHPSYASSCNNLGDLYATMGQYEKAEPLLLEAKQIRERVLGKEHPEYAMSCNNLANLYNNTGQYEKAEPLMLESKQIFEKLLGKESPEYAMSCNNLANLYMQIVKYEQAEALFVEGKQIQERVLGNNHPDYGKSCNDLALLYWIQHRQSQAEKEFRESFSVETYNQVSFFQFTNENEKAAYLKNISGADDIAYSFYVSEKIVSAQPYSLSLFHRNLILSSSEALKKQIFSVGDTALINKYNNWVNLKNYLAVLYSRPVSERKEDPVKMEAAAGDMEKELTRLSSGFKKQYQKVDWENIRSKIKPDEAAIEFVSFHLYTAKRQTDTVVYLAILLKNDLLKPKVVFLFNEKQFQNLMSSTGNKATNDGVKRLYASRGVGMNDNTDINKSIYELVWKPLEKELVGKKTVYFAPAGMLHRISFAALPINKHEFLSDRYRLVQLASTASIIDLAPGFIDSSDKLQLYGGIKYNADSAELKQANRLYAGNFKNDMKRSVPDDLTRTGSFDYLPGTEAEIGIIEKLANANRIYVEELSGAQATEESFKALEGYASPSVLHIATHGFFFPDPKTERKNNLPGVTEESGGVFRRSDNPLFRSGLLFAGANMAWQGKPIYGIEDGILTSYEVSNMYLPNTKLVVLSACETALGEIQGNEGVYGLQRAFKIAGVQNLVMSLWKVPDTETAEFMQEFYKNLFVGKSISNSFYGAQTTMKNKYRAEPYKWAAWILVR
jgi:tetratricopeptide (TPR) repeat protein